MKYGSCEEGESTPLKGGCPDETNDGVPATGASADKKKVFVAMAVAFVVGIFISAMGVTSKNFMAAQLVNLKKHRHDDASYYTDDYFYGAPASSAEDDATYYNRPHVWRYYEDDYFSAPASPAEDDTATLDSAEDDAAALDSAAEDDYF